MRTQEVAKVANEITLFTLTVDWVIFSFIKNFETWLVCPDEGQEIPISVERVSDLLILLVWGRIVSETSGEALEKTCFINSVDHVRVWITNLKQLQNVHASCIQILGQFVEIFFLKR